jgi:nucleotide-binding universal stress UspA family protein
MSPGTVATRVRKAMPAAAVDLYWIPVGAGGHYVRFNGRVFETIEAARRHRSRCDLYHAALVVELDGDRYTIELAPSPDADEASRGVVATGAVGSRHAGRLRLFRYEVRCWRGGSIPDLLYAVGGPDRLTGGPRAARRLLDLVATVPLPVWGRDELKAGEMWNSNSVIAWLIASAGLPTDHLRPPQPGLAPGWQAGLEVAARPSVVCRPVLRGRADVADRGRGEAFPMTKPIIAALDPDREDIAPAALGMVLARLTGEPLLLAAAYYADPRVDTLYPDYGRMVVRGAEEALGRAAAQIRAATDTSVTTIALPSSGSPARVLHELAERESAGALVIGSSSRGQVGRVLPGAVTDRLLHGAPCPVAVAPAGFSLDDAHPPRSIGVAFIDRPDGHMALTTARSLAGQAHAAMRVLTVAEPLDLVLASAPEIHEAARQASQQTAEAALARVIDGGSGDGQILSGDAAHAVATASEELDLLVCGARGHGPIRTLLLGGTSHALVRKAACPVLVVPLGSHLPDTQEPESTGRDASLQEA